MTPSSLRGRDVDGETGTSGVVSDWNAELDGCDSAAGLDGAVWDAGFEGLGVSMFFLGGVLGGFLGGFSFFFQLLEGSRFLLCRG